MTTILLVLPGSDLPKSSFLDEIYFDKWVHIGLFCGLTVLTAFPFTRENTATIKLLTKISISFIIYGVLMEIVQKYFASERTFDFWDIIADMAGSFCGLYLSNKFQLKIARTIRIKEKNKPL